MTKIAPNANGGGGKMIPADCVSVLLMALGNTSISSAQYEIMSALDGTRTASGFQHQFRSIIAKAKELKARVDRGETFTPVLPAKKRAASSLCDTLTPPNTPKKPRMAPKPRGKNGEVTSDTLESPNSDL